MGVLSALIGQGITKGTSELLKVGMACCSVPVMWICVGHNVE